MEYVEQKECRICGSKELQEVIDLGELYPSNFVESTDGFEKVPLTLVQCKACGLVQLQHTVNLDNMYRKYYYKSSLNSSMVRDLNDIVAKARQWVTLLPGDVVLDIGCNDGTLFKLFDDKDLVYIGFDPALNLADEAREYSTYFINDYFSIDSYPIDRKAKVITSIAMFYDLPDPNKFVAEVEQLLRSDGIWIIQFTDLVSMLKINAFDNICHEHLEYYSLKNIVDLVNNFGMNVIDIEHNSVNGGSLQIVVAHKNWFKPLPVVNYILDKESEFLSTNPLEDFKNNIMSIKANVLFYLENLEREGKLVYGLGASTKGNTLLQYFGIGNGRLVQKIAEINKDKWGLKTIGTDIPIISQEQAIAENPTAFLVLPWHFIDTFTKKDKQLVEYLKKGSMIVPMPEPALYFRDNGHLNKIFLNILRYAGVEGNIEQYSMVVP